MRQMTGQWMHYHGGSDGVISLKKPSIPQSMSSFVLYILLQLGQASRNDSDF